MADYTPIVNYAGKDNLSATDGNRLVKGRELDREFSAIETAINSKLDNDFVLETVEFPYPRLYTTTISNSVSFNDFNLGQNLITLDFAPEQSTSQWLFKVNVKIEIGVGPVTGTPASGTRTGESGFLRFFVRNLETNIEEELDNSLSFGFGFSLRDADAGNEDAITIEGTLARNYGLFFRNNKTMGALVGPSSAGYRVRVFAGTFGKPNASAVFDGFYRVGSGNLSAQEIFQDV